MGDRDSVFAGRAGAGDATLGCGGEVAFSGGREVSALVGCAGCDPGGGVVADVGADAGWVAADDVSRRRIK